MADEIEIYCTMQVVEGNNGIIKALIDVHPQHGLSLGEYLTSNLHRSRGEFKQGETWHVTFRRAEPRLVED